VEPAGKERRRDGHYHRIRSVESLKPPARNAGGTGTIIIIDVEPAGRTGRRDQQYEVSRDGEASSSFSTGNGGRERPGLQRRRKPRRPYIRNTDGTTA
jgi:hypothetical protein